MRSVFLSMTCLICVALALSSCSTGSTISPSDGEPNFWHSSTRKSMRPFQSEEELGSYLAKIAKRQNARDQGGGGGGSDKAPAAAVEPAKSDVADGEGNRITNVQHNGVDEGGIVKLHGSHLVILRRGRLFTVQIGDGALKPVSTVDAFGPDIDPRSTWYDEMLISEGTIAVIGYSYERRGTEVGLFNIDQNGNLSCRSTYHLRSNDYYSSRNYASRLIGNKLIFYAPLYLNNPGGDRSRTFPAVRKWHKGATEDEFKRIVPASHVYRPERPIESIYGIALHTVTVCDLSDGGFKCEASSVIGPAGRIFYVSPQAVYVWVTDWARQGETNQSRSMLYRMPLDGSAPSALGVAGSPVDQFSFLEDNDGYINVLVRSFGHGEAMWSSETTQGDVAVMRVPTSSFSDGSDSVPADLYRPLPKPEAYTFQNRFVGDYLLYGTGSGWGYPQNSPHPSLIAVKITGGDWQKLPLAHGVDRIEALGSDALVVGTNGKDLTFTAIRLGEVAEVADQYTKEGASQGELRSHGFFYKQDDSISGTLGLPISTPGRPGYKHLVEGSASILFLRNSSLHFKEIGELSSGASKPSDDACRASCVDWYGNARPLFIRGRVFALLGYEIVEGRTSGGQIQEVRRVNYSPARG